MSRSNPYKKKPRFAKRTLLIFGEGLAEEMFLRHLKSLYSHDGGVRVKILRGKGGSPADIVVDAVKAFGDYDKKVVVLDNDKSADEMEKARREAKLRSILLLEHTPCLEAVLLKILGKGGGVGKGKSDWCKSEFESKYIGKKKRDERAEYEKVFPKTLLDKRRIDIYELEALISLLQGK